MKSILVKELNSFFAHPLGYVLIGVFLLFSSLLLWVFNNDYNLFNYGFAHLAPFYELLSWMLLFLVPALSMKSFSDEIKQGTIEILFTKPISLWQLTLGKFFGNWMVIAMAIFPTLLYIVTIYSLAQDDTTLEYASFFVSYFGSILLAGCFVSISLFCSAIAKNALISFLFAVILCFLSYFALDGISQVGLFGDASIGLDYLSLSYHFKSLTRGVIDSRNIVFMLSVMLFFLFLTQFQLRKLID